MTRGENPLGTKLKNARKQLTSWNQRDAAEQIGISPQELSGFERGARPPTPRILSRMLDTYGASPSEAMEIMQLAGYDMDLPGLLKELGELVEDESVEPALKNELGRSMEDLIASFQLRRNGKPEWAAIPIAGKHAEELALDRVEAMVEKIIDEGIACGLKRFVFVIRDSQQALVSRLREKFKKRPSTPRLELQQTIQSYDGLIGAIHAVGSKIGRRPIVLMFPDDRMKVECLGSLLEMFRKHRCCMLSIREKENQQEETAGMVTEATSTDDPNVKDIIALEEKQSASGLFWILGRYVLTEEIFGVINDQLNEEISSTELTDALSILAKNGRVKGTIYSGKWKYVAPYRRDMWAHLDSFLSDDDSSWRSGASAD